VDATGGLYVAYSYDNAINEWITAITTSSPVV
jgi:hypothetical protein